MGHSRILYLENNQFIADQVKMRLEWQGYQVVITDNEPQLIKKIHEEQNDLLIIDVLSPTRNVFSLLEDLKNQNLMLPTIIVSDKEDFHQAIRAMHLGCLDFIVKSTLVQDYFDQISESIFRSLQKPEQNKASKIKSLAISRTSHDIPSIIETTNWEYFPDQDIVQCSLMGNGSKTILSYAEFTAKIHFDDFVHVKTQNNVCLLSHETVTYNFRYMLDNGEVILYQAQIKSEVNSTGMVTRLYGCLQIDATDQDLDLNQRIKLSFLDKTTDAVFITNLQQQIISVNSAFTTISGYSEQEILHQKVSILNSGEFDKKFYKQIVESLNHKSFWQGEVLIRHQKGISIPVSISSYCLKDETGCNSQTITVLRDISEQKAYEESIKLRANYDSLTQLPNRSLFLDRLANAIKLGKRNHSKLALMLLDLNKFKWINDSLGHHAGDILLQETAKKILASVRTSDTVARLGGDEFSILVPELEHTTDAEIIISKIFQAFKKPVLIDQQEVFISGCIGITIFPDDGDYLEVLQKNADSAMYMAKQNGCNSYYYFTQAMQEETEQRLALIEDMRLAIINQEFSLHYQPIIDIVTNRIDSAETLLRWKHPLKGYIPLNKFLPVAEESGLIREIGNWVIEEVASNIERWTELGLPAFKISLNQSVAQYYTSGCHIEWLDILQNKQIPLEYITFEISEKFFFHEKNELLQSIEYLKQKGIQISLDGFGTGYSSLSYLKKFPVDVIKIDRSFISSMVDDPVNAILVETIVILAKKLDIKVIATGIENEQQLDMLNQQCRYVQGYYFSRPLPLNKFEEFIQMQNQV